MARLISRLSRASVKRFPRDKAVDARVPFARSPGTAAIMKREEGGRESGDRLHK